MPGLLGFVGVDFLWREGRREAMILEINPRPTTSYVGLRRIVPEGTLARAWLAACHVPGYGIELLESLAEIVRQGPVVSFDVRDGHVRGLEDEETDDREQEGQGSDGGWLALDVGGANLKASHSDGSTRTLGFEVWRRPEALGTALQALMAEFPPFDRLAATMTAELCDCFPTRSAGVVAVLDAIVKAAGKTGVWIWGTDGCFHEVNSIREQPKLAAAANWLALATVAALMVPDRKAILIDVGSTTTDLIPLDRGRVAVRGRSDVERLVTGELVYAGVRRTPVCALATELPFRDGRPIGLAAELFATTLDVFLTRGDLEPDSADRSTADGRPATVEHARDRLARMIGEDRDGFGPGDAQVFAQAACEALMSRLVQSAERLRGHDRHARGGGCGRLRRVPAHRLRAPARGAGRPRHQPRRNLGRSGLHGGVCPCPD